MTTPSHPLRPFVPADTAELIELYAQSIEELTAEDYDEDQRLAWASTAADAQAFGARLGGMTTLVVMIEDDYAGFASLKADTQIDMLYVHPFFVRDGVGSALAEALERLAAGRGATEITVDSSDTAQPFFEGRGYVATQRNLLPRDDQWLSNMTMKKALTPAQTGAAGAKAQ